jgi:DNA-binding CsgD family transcriptional regulator
MKVYNSPHLIIEYEKENSRLINTWKSNPPNDLVYREELIEHLQIAEKIKPSQIIWILDKKTLKPTLATKKWVDENILTPIFRYGFVKRRADGYDQLAFVFGQDFSVLMQGVENPYTGFNPKYFANEIEAINWLSNESKAIDYKNVHQNLDITYKGIDDNGKIVFELKEDASKFDGTINLFKTIIEQHHFIKKNIDKYSCLTKREKETLKFIINGDNNKQISEKMFISSNTVRTHRNRIWKKLEIQNLRECLQYVCFFN